MKIPIFNHRTVIGFAADIKQAEKIIRKQITIPKGFNLKVWRRLTVVDLPDGYVFSISYTGK